MLIYKTEWDRLAQTDKRRWLMGVIIEISSTTNYEKYIHAVNWIRHFRTVPELEEYFHKLEEKS